MYAKISFFIKFTVIPQLPPSQLIIFNLLNYYHCYFVITFLTNIIYEIVGYLVNISNF